MNYRYLAQGRERRPEEELAQTACTDGLVQNRSTKYGLQAGGM